MLRTDHFVVPIWKPAASLDFYSRVMGLPLIDANEGDDWGGRPWLMLIFGLEDGRELVLVARRGAAAPADEETPSDARHYAFSVEEPAELDRWRDRLRLERVDFWEEDHGDQHSVYFADPNGVVLEITSPPSRPAMAASAAALRRAQEWIAR